MAALDIQPHPRHTSTLAVALLSLMAAGAFVAGLNNQLIGARGLSPFPAPSPAARARVADTIPEATPAPDMQVADAGQAVPRRAAPPAAPSPEDADPTVVPTPAVAADTPPAADAAATVTDPAPAPPPAPDNAPPV